MKELWTEKYRPTNIKGYVFRDDKQRDQVKAWLSDGALPHLLFSGAPGTGKTTLAKVLLNELNINPMDILHGRKSLRIQIQEVLSHRHLVHG